MFMWCRCNAIRQGHIHLKYHDIHNSVGSCKKDVTLLLKHFLVSTHWGGVTHICISTLTIIGSENGLLPGQHQAIIWTKAGTLPNGSLGLNFSEISIEIHTFSFKKMHLKMLSGNCLPFCPGLNVLTHPLLCHHCNIKNFTYLPEWFRHVERLSWRVKTYPEYPNVFTASWACMSISS